MSGSGVAWSAAIEEAVWIGPRLSAFGADRVDAVIPGGFVAYARLPHPVWWNIPGVSQRVVRWGAVSAWSEVAMNPTAQFHDIALPQQAPAAAAPWNSQGPTRGALCARDAAVLVELLAVHSTPSPHCWFCVWDGYAWGQGVVVTATATRGAPPEEPMMRLDTDPMPARVRSGPRVQLPKRNYLLYTGPIEDALAFVADRRQTPNLWWPQHHEWCVASDIDLQWTYVGGPHRLIETMLADPRLEAMPARPEDPIQFRLQGWLDALIADAADELLERGAVTVTTSRGNVQATLRYPISSSSRQPSLLVSHTTDYSRGSGAVILSASTDTLRGELRRTLGIEVTNLVNR
jgi:hypothetical protein